MSQTLEAQHTAPGRLVSSEEWAEYFRGNSTRLLHIPWERGAELTAAERRTIAASVQTFQLGETGGGSHLVAAAAAYAAETGDEAYVEAIRLFIAEEQRHGGQLGRFLDLAGVPRRRKHWSNIVFRRLRHLAGLELMISALLTAEVLAMVYYAALRRATGSTVLRRLCEEILKEEVAHIRFQTQRLRLLRRRRSPGRLWLTRMAQRFLFAGAALVVWHSHRHVLRAGGLCFRSYWRKARLEARRAMELMSREKTKVAG